ncbi:hypothetical protein [Streptomyces niveus]|uniref:Uncharacterized protein n=1 Tax=Streptomyces niveus TaxID=193462 RepID=A0A1U9QLN0_STRNV|nr:hypothetical protein [Streptomyces niveus]AQU64949.1 hypothetical protein BBN63_00370 [Streptomyces niveus]
MLTHLAEVCRAGSACPRILAHPQDEPAEVYRPENTQTDGNGIIDFLTSAESLVWTAIAVLAVVLLAATAWLNREEAQAEKDAAPPTEKEGAPPADPQ